MPRLRATSGMSIPPTTNLLHPHQRTRLMRSTRKLGAVLGTTPCLLENDLPVPLGRSTSRVSKRQGSIFTHKQISSLSVTSASSSHRPSSSTSSIGIPRPNTPGTQSVDSHPTVPPGLSTHDRRPHTRPQLCLQLNPVPLSPSSERLASSLCPPSPSPLTPSPTSPVPDVAEIRRKRVAKLARHLGEKIPLELVFSESTPKQPTVSRLLRRRSQPVHPASSDARTCPHRNTRSQSRPKEEWVGEWNRPDIRDVQRELRNLRVR